MLEGGRSIRVVDGAYYEACPEVELLIALRVLWLKLSNKATASRKEKLETLMSECVFRKKTK
jgi:hypothetical protein